MNKVQKLKEQIECIKQELSTLGDMRPGSLSVQKRSWGGEYLQLSYSHKGKGRTMYVREEDREGVMTQVANYKRFRELTKEWVDLSVQLTQARAEKTRASKG